MATITRIDAAERVERSRSMLPLAVDARRVPARLVGRGALALRRLAWLDAAGAPRVIVFSDAPGDALAAAAADRLVPRLPRCAELAGPSLVFVAGLLPEEAERVATAARRAGAIVNVEDELDLCDVHVPAVVRRGDLVVAVSTAGGSPALAARLRRLIDDLLPQGWGDRLDRVAALRRRLRREGAPPRAVAAATEALIDAEGGLLAPVDNRSRPAA